MRSICLLKIMRIFGALPYEKRVHFFSPIRYIRTKNILDRRKMNCSFQYFNVHRGQKYVNIWLALNIIAAKCASVLEWYKNANRNDISMVSVCIHAYQTNPLRKEPHNRMAMRERERENERDKKCGHISCCRIKWQMHSFVSVKIIRTKIVRHSHLSSQLFITDGKMRNEYYYIGISWKAFF